MAKRKECKLCHSPIPEGFDPDVYRNRGLCKYCQRMREGKGRSLLGYLYVTRYDRWDYESNRENGLLANV